MFAHVQRLNRLRAAYPELRRGETRNLLVSEQQWAYARVLGSGAVVVALNNAAAPATIELDAALLPLAEGSELEDALGGSRYRVEAGRLRVTLGARGAVVLVEHR